MTNNRDKENFSILESKEDEADTLVGSRLRFADAQVVRKFVQVKENAPSKTPNTKMQLRLS